MVPYGIDASGIYDVSSGEWQQPSLFGGGEYTRRRQVAVGFGVKMFLDDASPSGVIAGRKLARDTAIVNGSGGEFSALRNGYEMAQRMAAVADLQHAVGGVRLEMVWDTPGGAAPTVAGTYRLEVRVTDRRASRSASCPSCNCPTPARAPNDRSVRSPRVDRTGDTADDVARWNAAELTGWPTLDMAGSMAADPRFVLAADPQGADVTDAAGVARFDVDDSRARLGTRLPHAGADRERRSVLGHRRAGSGHLERATAVGLGASGGRRARWSDGSWCARPSTRSTCRATATCRVSCSPCSPVARPSPR